MPASVSTVLRPIARRARASAGGAEGCWRRRPGVAQGPKPRRPRGRSRAAAAARAPARPLGIDLGCVVAPSPRDRRRGPGPLDGSHARAVTAGAPGALQVADRWRRLLNIRQAVERWPARSHARLRRLPAVGGGCRPGRRLCAFRRTDAEIAVGAESRARGPRRLTWEVRRRHLAGETLAAIGRATDLARATVRKHAHGLDLPRARGIGTGPKPARSTRRPPRTPHGCGLRGRPGAVAKGAGARPRGRAPPRAAPQSPAPLGATSPRGSNTTARRCAPHSPRRGATPRPRARSPASISSSGAPQAAPASSSCAAACSSPPDPHETTKNHPSRARSVIGRDHGVRDPPPRLSPRDRGGCHARRGRGRLRLHRGADLAPRGALAPLLRHRREPPVSLGRPERADHFPPPVEPGQRQLLRPAGARRQLRACLLGARAPRARREDGPPAGHPSRGPRAQQPQRRRVRPDGPAVVHRPELRAHARGSRHPARAGARRAGRLSARPGRRAAPRGGGLRAAERPVPLGRRDAPLRQRHAPRARPRLRRRRRGRAPRRGGLGRGDGHRAGPPRRHEADHQRAPAVQRARGRARLRGRRPLPGGDPDAADVDELLLRRARPRNALRHRHHLGLPDRDAPDGPSDGARCARV